MATLSENTPASAQPVSGESTGKTSNPQSLLSEGLGDAKGIDGDEKLQLHKFGGDLIDTNGHPISEEKRQKYEDCVRAAGLARWRYNEHGEIIGAIISYPLADKPTEIFL
jgi:hypothetical protein